MPSRSVLAELAATNFPGGGWHHFSPTKSLLIHSGGGSGGTNFVRKTVVSIISRFLPLFENFAKHTTIRRGRGPVTALPASVLYSLPTGAKLLKAFLAARGVDPDHPATLVGHGRLFIIIRLCILHFSKILSICFEFPPFFSSVTPRHSQSELDPSKCMSVFVRRRLISLFFAPYAFIYLPICPILHSLPIWMVSEVFLLYHSHISLIYISQVFKVILLKKFIPLAALPRVGFCVNATCESRERSQFLCTTQPPCFPPQNPAPLPLLWAACLAK